MYNTSDNYKSLVLAGDFSTAKIKGTIKQLNGNIITLDEDNIETDSVRIDWSCSSGSSLKYGTVIKGEMDLSFFIEMQNYYELIGATVKLSYFLDDEEIPLGIYTVSEPKRSGRKIKLTCYDNMSKIDFSLGNSGTNGTAYTILKWVEKNTGVELANTEEEIKSFVNSSEVLNISNNVFGSYIDVLAEICSVMCAFATINRFGQLEIREYKTEPVATIIPDIIFNASVCDYKSKYTELVSTIDSVSYTNTSGDGSGLTYSFTSQIVKGTTSSINAVLRNMINKMSKLEYTPANLSMICDPSYDLGDMVTICADGNYIMHNINSVITSINWTFLGDTSIKSAGENPYLQSSAVSGGTSNSTAAIAKNNATYIATFENAESYTINDEEKIISSIDYTNGENDTLIINGQCEIEVTSNGNFEIHYYIDGVKNSFTPIQYLTEGKHILNFSCWFSLEESNYLFSVQIGITGTGTGTIAADKVRSYVLGTTLAAGRFYTNNVFEETIPAKTFKNDIYPAGYEKEDENNEL